MTELKSEGGGKVIIADDILALIAAKAAIEVEGVKGVGGILSNVTNKKAVRKYLMRGVNISVIGQNARVAIAITAQMGTKLHNLSLEVQDRVKSSIETMTGLTVTDVNVRIGAISLENPASKPVPLQERQKA